MASKPQYATDGSTTVRGTTGSTCTEQFSEKQDFHVYCWYLLTQANCQTVNSEKMLHTPQSTPYISYQNPRSVKKTHVPLLCKFMWYIEDQASRDERDCTCTLERVLPDQSSRQASEKKNNEQSLVQVLRVQVPVVHVLKYLRRKYLQQAVTAYLYKCWAGRGQRENYKYLQVGITRETQILRMIFFQLSYGH